MGEEGLQIRAFQQKGAIKYPALLLSSAPLVWFIMEYALYGPGANPVEKILHRTGDWTLNFLLITLSITPLRQITGRNRLFPLRRIIGLAAFFYACLHFLAYAGLEHFFSWESIINDVVKHRRIIVGFFSFVILIPLALTSSKRAALAVGARQWRNLHRLIYAAAAGGIIHYLWLVKIDIRWPLFYAALFLLLMMHRLTFRAHSP